jgi:uncharacterized membrane protein HdeD (DUF308 family)
MLSFIFALVGGVLVHLQIYLSKKESKWLGLILPTISIFSSPVVILIANSHERGSTSDIFYLIMMSGVFACLLLAIYFLNRFKKDKTKL